VIVLDTHVWLFWAGEEQRQLSPTARDAIARADVLGVSVMSCWEVSMLVSKGRLRFQQDVRAWIRAATRQPRLQLLELTADIAVLAGSLGSEIHGDPADRIIMATALHLGTPLVTKDDRIRGSKLVETIW
jgi:PIN domain nuclease of toxin-antitoxin system